MISDDIFKCPLIEKIMLISLGMMHSYKPEPIWWDENGPMLDEHISKQSKVLGDMYNPIKRAEILLGEYNTIPISWGNYDTRSEATC